jgi:hypothetical protein
MSFWKGWSRGTSSNPPPAQESPLDAIKRIAKENSRRERLALEAKPRLNADQIAALVSRIRTLDDVKNAYSTLKGIDFCDVVAAVIKSGKMSSSDMIFTLRLREWVRTGAHLELSFPEWMEAHALSHFQELSDQWLQSGADPDVTFEEWLCSEPPAAEPANPVWAAIGGVYDPKNAAIVDGMLEHVYRAIYKLHDDPRLMAYYASMVCGVAVVMRMTTKVDVNDLKPPIAPSSISQLLDILDSVTKEAIKWLGRTPKDDPRGPDALNKMDAFLI